MGNSPNQISKQLFAQRLRAPNWSKVATQARTALQNYLYEEAITYCEAALQAVHLRPEAAATIRCLYAEALESLARFTEAIRVLRELESEPARKNLSLRLQSQVCLRLGSAYGGTAEIPQAIAFAKQAVVLATQANDATGLAQSHIVLGTLYRRLGELWFARDHFLQIVNNALRHGDFALLAQAHNGLGIVHFLAGEFVEARASFQQAINSLGTADAPLLRGSVDVNLATIATLQGQMRESVRLLERAIPQLERAHNPRLVVNAHSNLGYSLLRLGEISQAEEVLQEALHQARACEAPLIAASTLETLSELHFLQGNFVVAEQLIAESLANLRGLRVSFNQATALLTQGRGWLLAGRPAQALESFQRSLEICERMGDPRGHAAAQLNLIEAYLALGATDQAQQILTAIKAEVERIDTTSLIGHLREVSGQVALASGQANAAVRSFRQAISIREVMGDRYRTGVAHYYLGQAYARQGDIAAAQKSWQAAREIFLALGAQPWLKQVETVQASLGAATRSTALPIAASEQVITALTRLLEADFSRDVLLQELLGIFHDELKITPVILFQEAEKNQLQLIAYRGCTESEALAVGHVLPTQKIDARQFVVHRWADKNEWMWLYLGKRQAPLPDSLLTLLLRQTSLVLKQTERPTKPLPTPPLHEVHPISLPGLVYRSAAMKQVVEQILSLHSSDITVLVTGETGTGKELVARAIHAFSKRAAQPFIPFNCAAAPRELIESQLFGHRRGAFTGATADFPGMIGAAEKGTLFLDEIGELPREMQPKLLRFLQNGEIQRLGETTPRTAGVRVLAATNRTLEEMVTAGEFRADLYYRLNVIQLHLPPLRERREEIPLLVEHFLARYLQQTQKQGVVITPAVLQLLHQYDWPGNTRQLENEMQRLVAFTQNDTKITEDLLSLHIRHQARIRLVAPSGSQFFPKTLADAVADTERQMLNDALARHKNNITRAAAELGVSRYGLRKMLQRHHLPPQRKAQ